MITSFQIGLATGAYFHDFGYVPEMPYGKQSDCVSLSDWLAGFLSASEDLPYTTFEVGSKEVRELAELRVIYARAGNVPAKTSPHGMEKER